MRVGSANHSRLLAARWEAVSQVDAAAVLALPPTAYCTVTASASLAATPPEGDSHSAGAAQIDCQ